MIVVGNRFTPAISVTTSTDPIGVFVTPTLHATINAGTSTHSLVPGSHACAAVPSAAPMKNNGMMNPPRHPVARVTAEATSFVTAPSNSTLIARSVVVISPIWASPNVKAYGDTQASKASTSPPSAGRALTGIDLINARNPSARYVNATATSAPTTPHAAAQARSPECIGRAEGNCHTGS